MTFTETKLDETVPMGSLTMPCFTSNRRDRTCHGGGVLTYVKSTLKPKQLTDWQEAIAKRGMEMTLTEIRMKQVAKPVLVIGVYRPPQSKPQWFDIFNEIIAEVLSKGWIPIIMGDLNANLLNPTSYPGKELTNSLKLAGAKVKEVMPTRIGKSSATCLDIIAISEDIQCDSYEVESIAASDHFPVSASIRALICEELHPVSKRSFKDVNMVASALMSRALRWT
jgi:endonuclease/exonuclease/phosphatase family metal-dependent hydrolase